MITLIDNDAKGAAASFQDAVNESANLTEFDESARLTMMQRLAFCYIRMGDGAKAEALFRTLITAFTRIAGPESPNVLRVRLNLAQAFMIEKKHADAIREANAIFPEFVARLGADHELTMQLLTTRAQSEGSLGLWDDAVRDDLAIHDLAVKKQGPQSFFAVATLSDAALAQCRGGHLREGESNARSAFNASVKAFGPRAGLTGGTAYTLASCLTELNQLSEAATLLKDIDVPVVAQLAGDPDFGAGIDLVQAEIAFRQGNLQASRNLLEKVSAVFMRDDAEAYQKRAFQTLKSALGKSLPAA
jgi:tetratricopeptide (TPR) repeat protein